DNFVSATRYPQQRTSSQSALGSAISGLMHRSKWPAFFVHLGRRVVRPTVIHRPGFNLVSDECRSLGRHSAIPRCCEVSEPAPQMLPNVGERIRTTSEN